MIVDLRARRTGIGSLGADDLANTAPVLPRLHLFLAPLSLIAYLVVGYSATYAALMGTGVAFVAPFLRKNTRPNRQMFRPMFDDIGKQASQVAIPIAAIGIIIAVAIQSNLAIKFSTRPMEISGGTLLGAMIFIIIGCIIMGMGMPTVAAYIMGISRDPTIVMTIVAVRATSAGEAAAVAPAATSSSTAGRLRLCTTSR